MSYRIVNEVDAGLDDRIAISSPKKKDGESVSAKGSAVGTNGGTANGGGGTGNGRKMDEDEERDAVFFRLEMLGYRVGQGLVER